MMGNLCGGTTMSVYYISTTGCDDNNGLSADTPWQTIPKVNSTAAPGDEIRFRCGDTFYGALRLPHGINEDKRTQVTSYGQGKKPVISQYKYSLPGSWEQHCDSIYKLDLTDTSKFGGNTCNIDSGVGFFKVNGTIYYKNKSCIEDLCENWDFCNDGKYVYVKLDKNPEEYSSDILMACNIKMIEPRNFLRISGISFCGTGGHGFQGVACGTHISDCEFREIGGSFMYNEHGEMTKIRYGNGTEFWTDSKNCTVENCYFSDIYDVAMSMQGWKCKTNWENIAFKNNTVYRCNQAFEIWTKTETEHTGIINCYFENNVCVELGFGWGYDARPDKDQACHLLMYHRECEYCDVHVRGNTFIGARNCFLFKTGGAKEIPSDYKIYDNIIVHTPEKPIVFRWGGTDESDYTEYENSIRKNNMFFDINKFNTNT